MNLLLGIVLFTSYNEDIIILKCVKTQLVWYLYNKDKCNNMFCEFSHDNLVKLLYLIRESSCGK